MNTDNLTIAVTGLNATDNPGPGITVIRALRHDPGFSGRIVGLAYDTLDPGVYARDLVDDVFLIPYPSEGPGPLLQRLTYIHQRTGGLDVVLPTLDAELPAFIELGPALARLGAGTFLPTREQLAMRSKAELPALGRRCDIPVPASRVITAVKDLYDLHAEIPFPILVKGRYYGAEVARSVDEAVVAFHRIVAAWGLPVIVQRFVAGEELDVVAVRDGAGGLVGAMPMKKTFLTDKGKAWAGIAITDDALLDIAGRFAASTRWRGPCELELIRDSGGGYHLIEVNPRFPAWAYLAAGAGMNLPRAVVALAAGRPVAPMRDYRAGTMFVRIAIDQIGSLEDLQAISQLGEIVTPRLQTMKTSVVKGA